MEASWVPGGDRSYRSDLGASNSPLAAWITIWKDGWSVSGTQNQISLRSSRIRAFLTGLFLCGWATAPGLAASGDPAHYVLKSTWHESLLASLAAAGGTAAEDGFAPFESDTMRGGDPARQITRAAGRSEGALSVRDRCSGREMGAWPTGRTQD